MSSDPDSYTPQEVAIGPYHYWRQGFYEMITYKLVQRKELKDTSMGITTWMMAINASFLLEFLQIYAIKEGKLSATTSSISMLRLLDYAKGAHNAIRRDMVILENQIPLFVLRKKIEVQYSSLESADDMLQAMLLGFCEELLPFQILKDIPKINVSERAHLLDFLYGTIVPKAEQKSEINEVADDQGEDKQATQKYFATNGNILAISFDTNTTTLHLPSVSLDVNSKVILRNLVAYEASNASGPLVSTRYTELMNGIIDTEEDVKLLRRKGILLNRLKSDAEVANLWNGMSKSIKLTKVPHLNKVIEDVNNYYNNRLTVRFWKYTKLYVFSSWQFFTLLATIMLHL
ncbi:putative UPF0481 protein [Citrus sinensis]|uniref:UPF0481 protein n=1 Tax=Citrus sinensis TaxID=2711 RepID=A0ACB8JDJ9_CITSI|nr:putative UPF0481 protein [Citrus sinensis]